MVYYSSSISVNEKQSSDPPEGATSGDGGNLIDVSYEYSSSVDTVTLSNGDVPTGTFLGLDGLPISGLGTIFRGEEPVSQGEVGGVARLPGSVPTGVESGQDSGETDTFNFVFEPSITGINFIREDYINNPIGEIQYGKIQGKVKDVDGNPVVDDPVEASGAIAVSDEKGNYELVVPGGVEATISAAGDAQSVNIAGGNTINVDFIYSRLTVRVLAPDKSPVAGSKVKINNKTLETNEKGEAVIELAKTQEYDIRVGEVRTQEEITQSGEEIVVTLGNSSAGMKIEAADSSTGEFIGGTTCEIRGSGIISRTGDNGIASAITQEDGENVLVVAQEDKRYVTEEVDTVLTRGEMEEVDVELARKNNTPTL